MKFILDAGDYLQLADFWKRAPDITRTRLMEAVTAIDVRLQGDLKQNLPRGAAGAAGLAGSIAAEEQAFDDNVIGAVFTPVPYAPFVELGTVPHWAPIQPILDWVKVKFGLLDKGTTDVAYAIRASIAQHGTNANPVWQQTWDAAEGFVRATFDECMVNIGLDLAGGAA